MSEKRFIVESVMITKDCNEDKRIVKVITDKEELYSYDDLYEISDLLNEQQATISQLKQENEKLKEEKQRLIYHINQKPKRWLWMSEYEDKLNIALANITDVRNNIIQQIETEYKKEKPNELRIFQLTDYKIELLDQKLRLQSMIRNLHKIEENTKWVKD